MGRLRDQISLGFDDIMICPADQGIVKSRSNIKLDRLPIIAAPMDSVVGVDFLKAVKASGFNTGPLFVSRFLPLEEQVECFRNGGALSLGLDQLNPDNNLLQEYLSVTDIPHILIDTAWAGIPDLHIKIANLFDALRLGINFYTGNYGTRQGLLDAQDSGAITGCRLSIGPGAGCSTRTTTGVGASSVDLLLENQDLAMQSAKSFVKPPLSLIADGGIHSTGDICKALACGADYVMLGKMFAECVEARDLGSKVINGITYAPYRGMASSGVKGSSKNVEGVEGWVARTRTVKEVLSSIDDAIRSAISYTGGNSLRTLQSADVIRVSGGVQRETGNPILQSLPKEEGKFTIDWAKLIPQTEWDSGLPSYPVSPYYPTNPVYTEIDLPHLDPATSL